MAGFWKSAMFARLFPYRSFTLANIAVYSSLYLLWSKTPVPVRQASCSVSKRANHFHLNHYGVSKNMIPPQITEKSEDSSSKFTRKYGNYGEDAFFMYQNDRYTIFGVADGVGGWASKGVNSAKFSNALVKHAFLNSVRMVENKDQNEKILPNSIMTCAYNDLLEYDKNAYGSSTACFAVFDNETKKLYVSNLGDSGCFIYKANGKSLKSKEQCHYGNCPYQLSQPPPEYALTSASDRPKDAFNFEYDIQCGDYIVIATDGVWDNVDLCKSNSLLRSMDSANINDAAIDDFSQKFFEQAVVNSKWDNVKPRENAKNEYYGAKVDDITLIVAALTSS